MSNELMKPASAAAGAMEIATSRESADSQTQMIAAKHYPRDEDAALSRILRACERRGLAEAAVYSYKKGDGVIEGASIRLAEVMAQNWGNLDCGWRVLRSTDTESEVQAHAWDLETNTRKVIVFNVPHLRTTKTSSYILKDPREIYELQANNAARRIRACILSLIPGDITESAVAACEATMSKAIGKSLPDRIKDMVEMFSSPGMLVTEAMLEARLQTKRVAWTAAQVGQMGKLFIAIRDGFINRDEIPEFAVQDPAVSKPAAKTTPKKTMMPTFQEQIESARREIDLDATWRAIEEANVPVDEAAFYKSMIIEARERLKAAVTQ